MQKIYLTVKFYTGNINLILNVTLPNLYDKKENIIMKIISPDLETRKKVLGNIDPYSIEYQGIIRTFTDKTAFIVPEYVHVFEKKGKFFILNAMNLKKIWGDTDILNFFMEVSSLGIFDKNKFLYSVLTKDEAETLYQNHFVIKKDDDNTFFTSGCNTKNFKELNYIFDNLHIFLSNNIPLWNVKVNKHKNMDIKKLDTVLKKFLTEEKKNEINHDSEKISGHHNHHQKNKIYKLIFYSDSSNENWEAFTKTFDNIVQRKYGNHNIALRLVTPVNLLNPDRINFLRASNVLLSVYQKDDPAVWEKNIKLLKEASEKIGPRLEVVFNTKKPNKNLINSIIKFTKKEINSSSIRINILNDMKGLTGEKKADYLLELFDVCKKNNINENIISINYRNFFEEKSYETWIPDYSVPIAVSPSADMGFCRSSILEGKNVALRSTDFSEKKIKASKEFLKLKNKIPLLQEICRSCFAVGICRGGCISNYEFDKKGNMISLDKEHCDFMLKVFRTFTDEYFKQVPKPEIKEKK